MESTVTRSRPDFSHVTPEGWFDVGHGLLVALVEVTPELATTWLTCNHVNRNIREQRIEHFSHLIVEGNLLLTGETIQFEGYLHDGSAALVNGQHRLSGIVAAERPALLLVVQGVARGSQVYIDTGARRTFADVLRMERGVSDPNATSAVVRLGYMIDVGRATELFTGGGQNPPNNGELLTWYDRHGPKLEEPVLTGRRVRRELGGNASAAAIARLQFDAIDADAAEVFFDDLCGGIDLMAGDPILAMRKWYINRPSKVTRLVRAPYQLALLIKTWNNRRAGNPMRLATFHPYDAGGPTGGKQRREAFPTPI
jgi:hypothetical protein